MARIATDFSLICRMVTIKTVSEAPAKPGLKFHGFVEVTRKLAASSLSACRDRHGIRRSTGSADPRGQCRADSHTLYSRSNALCRVPSSGRAALTAALDGFADLTARRSVGKTGQEPEKVRIILNSREPPCAMMDGAGKGPEVSIILPVYNAEEFLDEAFQSILEQSFLQKGGHLEVSIFDDGSHDSSAEIVEQWRRQLTEAKAPSLRKRQSRREIRGQGREIRGQGREIRGQGREIRGQGRKFVGKVGKFVGKDVPQQKGGLFGNF
eukprot:s52_g26.t1